MKNCKIFEVPIDILQKSKLFADINQSDEDEENEIELKEVDGKNLERIIEYLKHYKDMEPKEIPKPYPEGTGDAYLRSILNDDWTFDYIQSMTLDEAINL